MEKCMDMLFPPATYCLCCGSIIDSTRKYCLCDKCIRRFMWAGQDLCDVCGRILPANSVRKTCPDCRENVHSFDRGYTCASYGLYERMLMMDLKYKGKAYIGRVIGEIMADRMDGESLAYDVIIPVPVHKKRLAERGYDQAEIVAVTLGKRAGKPVMRKAMERIRETPPLKDQDAHTRRKTMEGAFRVFSAAGDKLSQANVLLVDDIYTTGATLDSAATALKDVGVGKVYVLTFAAGNKSLGQQ